MKKTTKDGKKPAVKTAGRGQGRFHIEFKNPAQKMAWAGFQQHDILFLCGPAGVGKAQPVDSIVYTPYGRKSIGNLKIGDAVCSPNGGMSVVVGIHPQGAKPVFRVAFHDGSTTECCGEHLWNVSSNVGGWKNKIFDTNWIAKNCRKNKGKRRHLYIQATKPVEFINEQENELLNPYLMGVLLGDGGFSGGSLVLSSADAEIIDECRSVLTDGYDLIKSKSGLHSWFITNNICGRNQTKNKYIQNLKRDGLWGHRSFEKFIPERYLFSSVEFRMKLLQGLMDTDGTVSKHNGQASFVTTSEKLAEGVIFLCESLGFICKKKSVVKKFNYKGKLKEGRIAFLISIGCDDPQSLFRLTRKKEVCKKRTKYAVKRIIDRVEPVGEKDCVCITVSNADGLYLTNNFIVTHNSYLATAFAINEILQGNKKRIVLTRPIVESGRSLGYLPGTFEEKVNPYMMPLFDCIKKLVGENNPQRDLVNASIEIAPLAYMRGRTFDDAICIFDEAQNASEMELKLFMTRFGENSKLIIDGDPSQSDLMGPVALVEVMKKLENVPGIGTVRFKTDSIVRHPLVAKVIERLGN
jgi:phosphate starvation-inducible protein PhoH